MGLYKHTYRHRSQARRIEHVKVCYVLFHACRLPDVYTVDSPAMQQIAEMTNFDPLLC
jgi:hypothetical protein